MDCTTLDTDFLAISTGAARIIMDVYHARDVGLTVKSDSSPVTLADQKAEDFIIHSLQERYPGIPIIAEESVSAGIIPDIGRGDFFLVDPLDGTREFIRKRTDFTVNIALIRDGRPFAGIVHAPVLNTAWFGMNQKAFKIILSADEVLRHSISVRPAAAPVETAVVSYSHNNEETDNFIRQHKIPHTIPAGSSLKFCLVAEGKADIYPRFGRTMEWDIAAGDAVLRAAGGITVTVDQAPITYGKTSQPDDSDFANPHFIAQKSL